MTARTIFNPLTSQEVLKIIIDCHKFLWMLVPKAKAISLNDFFSPVRWVNLYACYWTVLKIDPLIRTREN